MASSHEQTTTTSGGAPTACDFNPEKKVTLYPNANRVCDSFVGYDYDTTLPVLATIPTTASNSEHFNEQSDVNCQNSFDAASFSAEMNSLDCTNSRSLMNFIQTYETQQRPQRVGAAGSGTQSAKPNTICGSRETLSRCELISMLAYLEGELQARDIVIAVLRNEQIKHYLQTMVATTRKLRRPDDPRAALYRDQVALGGQHISRQTSIQAAQAEHELPAIIDQQMESLCQVVHMQRGTQQRVIRFLSESLEANQKMRHELEEEKRKHERDTAQGDDITYGLEIERTRLRLELEAEKEEKQRLEKEVQQMQEAVDFERDRQKKIVLLLLADRKKVTTKYIEERKRSEDLAQILSEEKQRSDAIADGLEEESKKSLRMEAEVEKQMLTFEIERKQLKICLAKEEKRAKELEMELSQLRYELEVIRRPGQSNVAGGSIRRMTGGAGNSSLTLQQLGKTARQYGAGTAPTDEINYSVSSTTAPVSASGVLLGPTAASSVINVAKVVQPSATVTSFPVTAPTTGIARSLNTGQIIRQEAIGFNSSGDMMGIGSLGFGREISDVDENHMLGAAVGPTKMSGHQNTISSYHTPAVLTTRSVGVAGSFVTSNTTAVALTSTVNLAVAAAASENIQQSPAPLVRQTTLTATTLPNNGGNINNASNLLNNINISNILNNSANSSSSNIIPLTAVGTAASPTAALTIARGVPPPIPPNKPIVPPKREPSSSFSRTNSLVAPVLTGVGASASASIATAYSNSAITSSAPASAAVTTNCKYQTDMN